jgi:para-aminobenzoate synthetase
MPMALEHVERPLWGVQFHPESISTDHGATMLKNFRRLSGQRSSYISSAIPSDTVSEPPRNIEVKEIGDWKVSSRKLHQYPSTEATFCSLFGDETPAFWLDSAEISVGRFSFMGSARGHREWLHISPKAIALNFIARKCQTPLLIFTIRTQRRLQFSGIAVRFQRRVCGLLRI